MNWVLLGNSLKVSIPATLMALLFGFLAALWVSSCAGLVRKWLVGVAVVALALPSFMVTNCWLHLLGEAGAWRGWLPFKILSLGGTIWILALMLWPISFFFTLGALQRIERPYFEVEPSMRGWAMIKWLLWPMTCKQIAQAGIITFVLVFNNFTVPAILQVKVLPAEFWLEFSTTFNYVAALKIGWPLVVIPLVLLAMIRIRRVSWLWQHSDGVSSETFRRQLGQHWFVLSGVAASVAIMFSVGVPLSQLLFSGELWRSFIPATLAGQNAIIHSLFFAVASASLILLLAIVTARWSIGFATWLPFLIPGVLIGLVLIWIFNRPPFFAFYQSSGIVLVAFIVRYLAPAWNLTQHALRETDPALNDVARLEGASAWQLFRHVQFPQIFPQLAAAWYITYLLCLWDVETLTLVLPPGGETVALRIFNMLHYGYNSQVNALCLLLLFAALLPLLIWFVSRRLNLHRILMGSAVLLVCAVSGCSDSSNGHVESAPSKKRFPVQSKLFTHVEMIGWRGTGAGQFNKPRSLTLDKNDNLFVVDMTARVQKFSPLGEFLLSWQMPETTLGKAKGMCRDLNGNVVVLEPHYQRVNFFTPEGKLVAQWGRQGTNAGELVLPRSVAVNSRGEVVVTEYTTVDRVQVFSADGQSPLHIFGQPGSAPGEFNRAEGVTVDVKDRIYVADSCNHRVQVFSPEGKFVASYGSAGSQLGEMSYPYDVRIDSAGLQYVCEFGNSRVQVFDVNHKPLEVIGGAGGGPGQLANPWSIDLDSHGNLYVADSQNHRVQKFIRENGTR